MTASSNTACANAAFQPQSVLSPACLGMLNTPHALLIVVSTFPKFLSQGLGIERLELCLSALCQKVLPAQYAHHAPEAPSQAPSEATPQLNAGACAGVVMGGIPCCCPMQSWHEQRQQPSMTPMPQGGRQHLQNQPLLKNVGLATQVATK